MSKEPTIVVRSWQEEIDHGDGHIETVTKNCPVALLHLNGPWDPLKARKQLATHLNIDRSELGTYSGLPSFNLVDDILTPVPPEGRGPEEYDKLTPMKHVLIHDVLKKLATHATNVITECGIPASELEEEYPEYVKAIKDAYEMLGGSD